MSLSTSQVASELGVSARQVRRSATTGRLVASRVGTAHVISMRQVQALDRTKHRGRDWSAATQRAALDLLTDGQTAELAGSARSRLKQRIRAADVGSLAGQILHGRVSLRRAASDKAKLELRRGLSTKLSSELGLSVDGGLGVLVAKEAAREARKARLGLDDSGDIAVIEGNDRHKAVLEAFALYTYGDARESSAAAKWILSAKMSL